MRRLRVLRKAETADDLGLLVEECDPPRVAAGEVLVEVHAPASTAATFPRQLAACRRHCGPGHPGATGREQSSKGHHR